VAVQVDPAGLRSVGVEGVKKLIRSVVGQLGRPHGRAAPVIAIGLNMANGRMNRAAVDALDLKPGVRVLDIGFGGGIGLRHALRQVGAGGTVVGVELSGEMVRRAAGRWRGELEARRLELVEGSVENLPIPDASVDAAYSVNSVYFWPDLGQAFTEISRVLKTDGRLVLAVQPTAIRRLTRFNAIAPPTVDRLCELIAAAGFSAVEITKPVKDVVLVAGTRHA
jgi:arsenite methyltransferase